MDPYPRVAGQHKLYLMSFKKIIQNEGTKLGGKEVGADERRSRNIA